MYELCCCAFLGFIATSTVIGAVNPRCSPKLSIITKGKGVCNPFFLVIWDTEKYPGSIGPPNMIGQLIRNSGKARPLFFISVPAQVRFPDLEHSWKRRTVRGVCGSGAR
jgi:hypothetical protein